jgi:phosphate transport system protein
MTHTLPTMSDDPLERLEEEQRTRPVSRVEFHEQLAELDRGLVEATQLVADAIDPVTTAFLQADRYLADRYVQEAAGVQQRCFQLEEAGYVLLARQSPVAGDLRRVIAVLRCVREVQRTASLIGHIAKSLTWVHPPSMGEHLRQIVAQLGSVSAELFHGAVEAWRTHDGLAAPELETQDDQVDLLQKVLLTEIYTGDQSVEESVSLALLGRYYERIGDHAVELAHQVTYFVTGDRMA